jgi:hypothetical protein
MGHGWRLLVQASACAGLLGACSLSPAIEQNSLDYSGTMEQVSNKSLVTNILRARRCSALLSRYIADSRRYQRQCLNQLHAPLEGSLHGLNGDRTALGGVDPRLRYCANKYQKILSGPAQSNQRNDVPKLPCKRARLWKF